MTLRGGDHVLLPQLCDQLSAGLMDRREFIRYATLLGLVAGAANSG